MAHVYVEGVTHIGEDNVFYPYSTVGVASQDLKYKGERARRASEAGTKSANLSASTAAPKAAGWSPKSATTIC
jgi:hypothetical protein